MQPFRHALRLALCSARPIRSRICPLATLTLQPNPQGAADTAAPEYDTDECANP